MELGEANKSSVIENEVEVHLAVRRQLNQMLYQFFQLSIKRAKLSIVLHY